MAQGEYVAQSLASYLQRHPDMEARLTQHGTCHYLTTESADKFEQSAALFMHEMVKAEHVELAAGC